MMLEGRDLIVFGEDFDRHPHCMEHLVRRFLPKNRVLWIETVGMRAPRLTLYDARRVIEKLRPPAKPSVPNLTRLNLLSVPYNAIPAVRDFNRRRGVRAIRRKMHELGFVSPLLLTSLPSTCDFVGALGESLSIYYCVDEFSQWPGIDPKIVGPMEDALLAKVDLVLTTSRALYEAKRTKHASTEILTHGVDRDHFRPSPPPASGRRKVGFFGLVDERVDLALVDALARRLPDTEFHFIGEVTVDVAACAGTRNVTWHGRVPYARLPDAIADWSALLLPYRLNEQTRFINPLKIKEYMATEKPIVSTPLPELTPFADAIHLAEDADGFARALAEPFNPAPARAHLRGESWEDKARRLSEKIRALERG